MKQNCEKARKPVTCTTKINIYSKNFLMLDLFTNPSNRSFNFEVFAGADRLGDLICNRPYSNENALSARTERVDYRAFLSTLYGTAAYWLYVMIRKTYAEFSHCTVKRMPTHANFCAAIVECVIFEADLLNADSLSSASLF